MCKIHPPDPYDAPMHHLPRNIYAAQPEVYPSVSDWSSRGQRTDSADLASTERGRADLDGAEVSMPVIFERDADALYDIRCELEMARAKHPPFRSLASAVVEIHRRADAVGSELVSSCGTMSLGVKRKLKQTAAMCVRALTENAT